MVESSIGYFNDLGFVLTPLTRGSYNVTGVPVLLGTQSPLLALGQLLDSLREIGETAKEERERHIAWTMAKSAAIPYGKNLTEEEMTNMLDKFRQNNNLQLTPSGKKSVVLLTTTMVNDFF